MEVMFDRVAGLDVGKDSVTVCVRTPGPRGERRSETRTFKTMFGSLRVMRDWLVEAGVTIAAMESTSTYWKPPFYCLEEVTVVWLLNAAHMKAVPGRKATFVTRSGLRNCWSTACWRRRSCRHRRFEKLASRSDFRHADT
jgi:transposase